jgi:heme-degrading monooxygenase HmoA
VARTERAEGEVVTETYTSGVLKVEPGREDDLVAAWTEFVEWASEQPGSGTFRLVRDVEHSSRFMSFAPWESFGAQRAWRRPMSSPRGWGA